MTDVGGVAADQLLSYIERVERLQEEADGIAADIKDVFKEAKSNGFDVKTMREVLKIRKLDEIVRQEREALLELYKRALGMVGSDGQLMREAA
jgi:uncharacterized protein (UPF0335 family)